MEIYIVCDRVWKSFDIIYCGTDKNIAKKLLEEGDQNRYIEVWKDGFLVDFEHSAYKKY